MFNFFDLQEDFEKLKEVILERHQYNVFDFVKKRTFDEISDEKYDHKLLESIKYYKENKEKLGLVDQRIYNLSDEIMKKLLN